MISIYTHKKLTWIDLESPTKEEIRDIMKTYNIHPLVATELLTPTLRPKVDVYDNLIYLIMHFPAISHKHAGHQETEIDFVIGKNFLITTHYGIVESLNNFAKVFEVDSVLKRSNMADHAGFLFFYMMRELYGNMADELDYALRSIDHIKAKIFSGHEAEMVQAVSNTERELLDFKQGIQPHKEVLDSFESAGVSFFGKEFAYYVNSIKGEYFKMYSRLETQKEILLELRETNDSLLATKTNQTMKVLTIIATLMLPSALLAGIFNMSTKSTPIVGRADDFWIIIGIMFISTIILFMYFKLKKWI